MINDEELVGAQQTILSTETYRAERERVALGLKIAEISAESMATGEVKTITVKPRALPKRISLQNFEIRDKYIVPRREIRKTDRGLTDVSVVKH